MSDARDTRYDATTILLHWATAVLILVLWIIGQTADDFPRGPFRSAYWSTHVVLGFVIAAVLIARLIWRTTRGRGLPAADRSALHVLAKATHYLLYLLLALTIVLGVVNAFIRGYPIYGLFKLPQVGDRELRGVITHRHELAANAVMIVALFHAMAALVHHYLWSDGVLRRMIPGLAPRGAARPAE